VAVYLPLGQNILEKELIKEDRLVQRDKYENMDYHQYHQSLNQSQNNH